MERTAIMRTQKNWVKDLVIYQIYPRSFMDSNGDGIGDLAGVASRLDYLKDLGINAIWFSPVYCSPNADNGYDISDYQNIMEEFGTMEDWEHLRDECHSRGIRIIMDLVVNHSSDEHAWFQESKLSRDNPKSDYYIWRDPVDGKEPNNWAASFGGSAWEYEESRGQYYLHLFSKKQPDLNWACPELREEIYSMMEWWVKKGVDGFRVDAISYLDKPEDFPDSPEAPEPDGYSFCMGMLAGRPGTHGYIHEMNQRIFREYNVMTVGEVSAPNVEELSNYVLTERGEFDMAIPFVPPIVEVNTWSPLKMRQALKESYEPLKQSGWWARFLSNHDKPRQVSLYGNDEEYWEVSAKMLAMYIHTLPGTPFVFQGEEIGMTNVRFDSIDQYNDPEGRNRYTQMMLDGATQEQALRQVQLESRDNARTPMQWDTSAQAGFTTGTPWLPVNPNYETINVEAQKNDPYSIYQCYRKLIAMRKEHLVLREGDLQVFDIDNENLIGYSRSYDQTTWLVFHNFSDKSAEIPQEFLPSHGKILLSNYDRDGGYKGKVLRPYESVIFLEL
jgi:oligo-1,6-glucosidase